MDNTTSRYLKKLTKMLRKSTSQITAHPKWGQNKSAC